MQLPASLVEVRRQQQHAPRLGERDQLLAVVVPRRTFTALPETDCMAAHADRVSDLLAAQSGLPETFDGFHMVTDGNPYARWRQARVTALTGNLLLLPY